MTWDQVGNGIAAFMFVWLFLLVLVGGTYMLFSIIRDDRRAAQKEKEDNLAAQTRWDIMREESQAFLSNRKLRSMVVALRRAIHDGVTHELKPDPTGKGAQWIPGEETPPLSEYGYWLTQVAWNTVPSDETDIRGTWEKTRK